MLPKSIGDIYSLSHQISLSYDVMELSVLGIKVVLQPHPGDKLDCLSAALLLNGQSVASWFDTPLNLPALLHSVRCSGMYNILVCTCGVPDCAGLPGGGFQVEHEGGNTRWLNTQSSLQRPYVSFDSKQYLNAANLARREFLRLYFTAQRSHQPFSICPAIYNPEDWEILGLTEKY